MQIQSLVELFENLFPALALFAALWALGDMLWNLRKYKKHLNHDFQLELVFIERTILIDDAHVVLDGEQSHLWLWLLERCNFETLDWSLLLGAKLKYKTSTVELNLVETDVQLTTGGFSHNMPVDIAVIKVPEATIKALLRKT